MAEKAASVLMLGNEAIARGAIEAGAGFVACYPGTPSSEVVESLLAIRGNDDTPVIEYSVNEKVAMEAACGAALAGIPSLVTMKHVGLNVAADPLFTAAYIGMPGGLVVLSADDPGCHSSQNEQDNRGYARMASICCLEPASGQEAKEMARVAFSIASELEEPVMLRTTTRVSHSRCPVQPGPVRPIPRKVSKPEASRCVPVPFVARKRHLALAEQARKGREIAERSPFNRVFIPKGKCEYGVIASGVSRAYLADALREAGWQDEVGILELGMTWPLPEKIITDFLGNFRHILVLEEGSPYLETDVRSLAQGMNVEISGKDSELTEFGEYSTSLVLERVARWLKRPLAKEKPLGAIPDLPQRPPNLCPGCAHRSVYYAVRKVFGDEAVYSSDIGCYTLGILPPLRTADFLVCMGSSVSAGSGYARASGKPVIGFIGDSTFFHSGMTGLANAVFNRRDLLVVILDNGSTAMTGHQPNPAMAQECLGEDAQHLDIERVLDGLGITQKRVVKAHNIAALMQALEELRDLSGVRVLLAREPCYLHARRALHKRKTVTAYVKKQGDAAETCLRELACPAFTRRDGKLEIDGELCSGCMACVQIAPKAIGARRSEGVCS